MAAFEVALSAVLQTGASLLSFLLKCGWIIDSHNPAISITAVQLPSFSTTNTTVTFTISHYIAVYNPNRGVFTYYDSSLQLLYAGNQPATFPITSFPISLDNDSYPVEGINGFRVRPSLEIVTRMDMAGRVRVLHFFTHHVDAKAECKVIVAINDGSVLGFYC
ncbi:hypothetical protein CTI12_AA104370 [Artemisia annua]|uniref:Late embryogenesis abundant protein LEA-2 subgroup domain-containing protein n=1 Tax=Artemisia annua TaxID=35608 RepID=A0A2U1PWD1_ARTAN|nr:hypothetical protein CTI12_AA104370 [Artemisia annua]